MKLLIGHISPETAYHVLDYPYGFRLRCQIRYWVEFKPKLGFRFVSQTSNPKKGNIWNKPKAGTYYKFGGALYLDDNDHVQFAGLSEYSTGAESTAFATTYSAGVPLAGLSTLTSWVAAKVAYDAARNPGDPLNVGLVEAREAFVNAVKETAQ
jgi:hypothetical protein